MFNVFLTIFYPEYRSISTKTGRCQTAMTGNHRAIAPRPSKAPTEVPSGTEEGAINPADCVPVGKTIFPSLTEALHHIDSLSRQK